jgi:hypothetical protein
MKLDASTVETEVTGYKTTVESRRYSAWYIWCILIVLLVTTIGLSLTLHGWKSRIPTFDLLPYIDGAHELIATGRLPDRGTLTSYGSYTPPGTTWLMLPGVLLFNDPRLYENAGSVILGAGTLPGIFLLARAYFGLGCAFLSVLLYGLSELGLFFSASLWPRGHAFFYVWMVYWAGQYVTQKKSEYLAAAMFTWAAGMYVFMEIAPALFILPVVWFFYRPPLKPRPLLFAAVAILAMWYPYLQFEYGRSFVDLRSQILRQKVLPANYKASWCDPQLVLRNTEVTDTARSADSAAVPNSESLRAMILSHLASLWGRWHSLAGNFERTTRVSGNSIVLTVLALVSLSLVSVPRGPLAAKTLNDQHQRWRSSLIWVAGGMVLFALAFNEFIIARYLSQRGNLQDSTIATIRWLQTTLGVAGILLLALKAKVTALMDRLAISEAGSVQGTQRLHNAKVFCLSLVIPWLILLVMVESSGRLERFWWLWPLQVIALVALVTYVPSILHLPRIFAWIGSILLIIMTLGRVVTGVKEAWLKPQWSGSDAAEVQVVNYVVSQLAGRNQAAIGYQIFIWRFMAEYNVVDPRYKIGADFDLLFKDLHGVANTNRCAEGVSSGDEFRIVQTRPTSTDARGKWYVDVPLDRSFHLLYQFGPYQVFKRG